MIRREPEEDQFSSSGTLYGAMESFGARDRRDELPTTSHRMMRQKGQAAGMKGEGSLSARNYAAVEGVQRDKSAFAGNRGSTSSAVVGEGGVAKFRVKSARGQEVVSTTPTARPSGALHPELGNSAFTNNS